MPSNRPSDELVTSRLQDMISREGISGVMDRYGVGRRTVQSWMSGGRIQSNATARSIARTGLRLGYSQPVIQNRERGRFTTRGSIVDSRAIAYERAQTERLTTRRNIAIREATTPSQIASAEAMPIEPDRDFVVDLSRRRQALLASGVTGDESFYDPEYGFWDSWDEWRDALESSYEQQGG